MLVRQKGSRLVVLIATSSVEQHGNEQRAGHPPTPAPGPLAPGGQRFGKWLVFFKRGKSDTVKIFKYLIFLFFFWCGRLLFGGCQASPDEFANRCRSARHSMPKSEILNGLEFVQRDRDLEALNSFGLGRHLQN